MARGGTLYDPTPGIISYVRSVWRSNTSALRVAIPPEIRAALALTAGGSIVWRLHAGGLVSVERGPADLTQGPPGTTRAFQAKAPGAAPPTRAAGGSARRGRP